MNRRNIGSRFEDFLQEDNLFEPVEVSALRRIISHQITVEMKRQGLTRTELARRMRTSRAAVDRLLDADNASITLSTLERAASALGKTLRVELA